jgi:hypothetical protein
MNFVTEADFASVAKNYSSRQGAKSRKEEFVSGFATTRFGTYLTLSVSPI